MDGATADHSMGALDPWTRLRHASRRTLRRAKYFTGDRPLLLPINMRLTPEGTTRRITDDTDIVIEGFPRSGNTFAVFAFRSVQEGGVHVASHIHHLAPLHVAKRRELPLLVVVREPVDCLASYLVAGPHARPAGVLREYVHHHRGAIAFGDAMVVATFDQVTTDLGSVIRRVNDRFGQDFRPFVHTAETEAAVFAEIEKYHAGVHRRRQPTRVLPRPDRDRGAEADAWRSLLLADQNQDLLAQARQAYEALAALAG